MRDMGKDDKSTHRLVVLLLPAAYMYMVYMARSSNARMCGRSGYIGRSSELLPPAGSAPATGANGWAGARPGKEKWTMSVLPTRVPLHGKGGRGGCEGIRAPSRDPHGSRPAVDLPLTLVASVPLPGCVGPGAGLVGGTGMGRMEKETDLKKGPRGEGPGSGARL